MPSTKSLPIHKYFDEIKSTLSNQSFTLLKADPGAGKTTGIPPFLNQFYQKILVLQPRRLATKLTASRVASLLGTQLGEKVGYQMRFDKKSSHSTQILFITEGIFTKMIQSDPMLSAWQLIILDEFHERNWQTDVALAYLKEITKTQKNLRVLVMSATLNTDNLKTFLDAPSIEVRSPSFPVEIHYRPFSVRMPLAKAVLDAVQELQNKNTEGNILVFLPGMGEIRLCQQYLERLDSEKLSIIQLSSKQSQNYQKIQEQPGKQYVILTTNVAETSITIPNVAAVIDLGLAKVSNISVKTDLPELITSKISQASCIQRQGRAGRTQPGICIRLFSETDYRQRSEHTPPEILRCDLSPIILDTANARPKTPEAWRKLPWLDAPNSRQWSRDEAILYALGVLSNEKILSEFGQKIINIPLEPRLAALVYRGIEKGKGSLTLLAALILESEIVPHGLPQYYGKCDVFHFVEHYAKIFNKPSSRNHPVANALFRRFALTCKRLNIETSIKIKKNDETLLRRLLFYSFADTTAKIRKGRGRNLYHLCQGGEAKLSTSSVLKDEEWILALNFIQTGKKGSHISAIQLASCIDPNWLKEDPFKLIKVEKSSGVIAYGKNKIENKTTPKATHKKINDYNSNDIKSALQKFKDPDALDCYHNKIAWLDEINLGNGFPNFNSEEFKEIFDDILREESQNETPIPLSELILQQLNSEQSYMLSKMFPTFYDLQGGRRLKIDYLKDRPTISAKIQFFYGLNTQPSVAEGKIPLTLILLAPNMRPAQITADLPGFWKGSYKQVSKELKRRYPKHDWPIDPTNHMQHKRLRPL